MSRTSIVLVAVCMSTLTAHGLDRHNLPPAIRGRYRAQVRGVYRGFRKGYKAWRRFERACAAEAARRADAPCGAFVQRLFS